MTFTFGGPLVFAHRNIQAGGTPERKGYLKKPRKGQSITPVQKATLAEFGAFSLMTTREREREPRVHAATIATSLFISTL
jgi:hypothetical protein